MYLPVSLYNLWPQIYANIFHCHDAFASKFDVKLMHKGLNYLITCVCAKQLL